MASRAGLPLGIDFSGGTIVVVKFDEPVGEDACAGRSTACRREGRAAYGDPADNEWLIRLPQIEERRRARASSRARAP
jgi:hypothetical protein